MADIEGMPLTVGIVIAAIAAVSVIVGFVWTIATIRQKDRADISLDISDAKNVSLNAVNRLEKKTDETGEVLHGRVNRLMEQDSRMQYEIGYIKGQQDTTEKFILKLFDKVAK